MALTRGRRMIKFLKRIFCKKKISEDKLRYKYAYMIAEICKKEYNKRGCFRRIIMKVDDVKNPNTKENYGTIKIEWSFNKQRNRR